VNISGAITGTLQAQFSDDCSAIDSDRYFLKKTIERLFGITKHIDPMSSVSFKYFPATCLRKGTIYSDVLCLYAFFVRSRLKFTAPLRCRQSGDIFNCKDNFRMYRMAAHPAKKQKKFPIARKVTQKQKMQSIFGELICRIRKTAYICTLIQF